MSTVFSRATQACMSGIARVNAGGIEKWKKREETALSP
jgi:hypothetical protein